MQRRRGELVPVAEAISDLGGPVAAIRDASPQARRGFTRFDQVNQLVSASEADPDRGFMARLLALCSLPRTNPGNRLQYKRVNGNCLSRSSTNVKPPRENLRLPPCRGSCTSGWMPRGSLWRCTAWGEASRRAAPNPGPSPSSGSPGHIARNSVARPVAGRNRLLEVWGKPQLVNDAIPGLSHDREAEGIVFQVCGGDAKESGGQINALGFAVAEGFDSLHELQPELEFPCLGKPLVQFLCLVGWQRLFGYGP